MAERVEVYRTAAGKWDWRKLTQNENENVTATSGSQGYENKLDAIRMAKQENPELADEILLIDSELKEPEDAA